jgi:hypothetical protein
MHCKAVVSFVRFPGAGTQFTKTIGFPVFEFASRQQTDVKPANV